MKISRKKVDNFWLKRTQIANPRIATHFKVDAALQFDVQFIRRFISKYSDVLDMGCGTCAITNMIAPHVRHVMAVDKFGAFLQSCGKNSNITTCAEDILTYSDNKRYDVIILFGVLNYFNPPEVSNILTHLSRMLKPRGVLLVKHACGVYSDVAVDTFSKEIGDHYHAVYRYIEKEKKLFSTHVTLEKVVDIYPKSLNRWSNTHFFAFVCRKKQ